jgi:hypothetical protein
MITIVSRRVWVLESRRSEGCSACELQGKVGGEAFLYLYLGWFCFRGGLFFQSNFVYYPNNECVWCDFVYFEVSLFVSWWSCVCFLGGIVCYCLFSTIRCAQAFLNIRCRLVQCVKRAYIWALPLFRHSSSVGELRLVMSLLSLPLLLILPLVWCM